MMGYGADKGITPLICEELFNRAEQTKFAAGESGKYEYSIEVSCECFVSAQGKSSNPESNPFLHQT